MAQIMLILSSCSSIAEDPDMGSALVDQLRCEGHSVSVIAFADERDKSVRVPGGTRTLLRRTTVPILKHVTAWPALVAVLISMRLRGLRSIDHLIVQAPLAVKAPSVIAKLLFRVGRSTAIVFDIFPGHQVQIGVLPRRSEGILRWVESKLLANFDTVTAMGIRNEASLRSYYGLDGAGPEIRIVRPWSRSRGAVRADNEVPPGPVRLVFGGQLGAGRRLDLLIDFLDLIRDGGLDLRIEIYSSGTDFERLSERYRHHGWLDFKNRVPREAYAARLRDCSVGVVVTDNRVTFPALPSKIADYCQLGLPTLCLVESASELFTMQGRDDAMHLNAFDFSPAAVAAATDFIARARTTSARAAASEMFEEFDVSRAVAELFR